MTPFLADGKQLYILRSIKTKWRSHDQPSGCYTHPPEPCTTHVCPSPPVPRDFPTEMSGRTCIVYGDGEQIVLRDDEIDAFLREGERRSEEGQTPDPLRVARFVKL